MTKCAGRPDSQLSARPAPETGPVSLIHVMRNNFLKYLRFFISCLMILGGVGSIISGLSPMLGGILTIFGVMASLYSYYSTEFQNQDLKSLIETQALLFAQEGFGNVYSQEFLKKLMKTGTVKGGFSLLEKALDINPNDKDALMFFSSSLALQLSYHTWLGEDVKSPSDEFKKQFIIAKTLAQRGLKLYPKEHLFLDTLGILLDTKGDHEKARDVFRRSGRQRPDPYWRILVATSWHLSGEHRKALDELSKAQQEGAKENVLSFYYGRALNSIGKHKDAIVCLKSAVKERGYTPFILSELAQSYNATGKFFQSAKFGFILAMRTIIRHPKHGFQKLLKVICISMISVASFIGKICWRITQHIPILDRIHAHIMAPDQPEFAIGNLQMKFGNYKDAESYYRYCCDVLPNRTHSLNNLAICLASQGLKEEAIELSNRAVELDSKDEFIKFSNESIKSGLSGRIFDTNGNVIKDYVNQENNDLP